MSEHKPLFNITAVDTQHELKVLVLIDGKGLYADVERSLQHFRVAGSGTSILELYHRETCVPIRASCEISAIYTDIAYKDGVVVVEIRACYDKERFRYTTTDKSEATDP